jgi:hypothetical protein
MTDASDNKDLVIIALKQRIGELISNYELDIANIRAQYTKLQHAYDLLKKDSTPQPEEKKEFPSVNELLQESNQ